MLEKELASRFCRARRAAIENDFKNLNPEQRKGVLATEGPLLILAGAGSGKTTVLTQRVVNLLRYGRGSDSDEVPDYITPEDVEFLEEYVRAPSEEKRQRQRSLCALAPVAPWRIIAITFTNKAAGELKSRLESLIGPDSQDIWASTFHSACVRILRRDIDKLGYEPSFTIYDADDSQRLVKEILKEQNLDSNNFSPSSVLNEISRAKDSGLTAREYYERSCDDGDARRKKIAQIYLSYEEKLRNANALDFDDLIFLTVQLLEKHEDVRERYRNQFRYVLVDEYQDTNRLQYRLVSLLTNERHNICVVGDDDQSIYKFRGATIENILSFEDEFRGTRVIRLEQNYRSTGNILDAANAVIRNNQGRKGKELWTEKGPGNKVQVHTASDEIGEAEFVAGKILEGFGSGADWKDFVILYRMNAQSNQMEQAMKRQNIPYKIIGGFRFFERAEVKDMLAYLSVINNPHDDFRLRRIINNPPRGLGNTTVERIRSLAERDGVSMWNVISRAGEYPELDNAVPKLKKFSDLIQDLQKLSEEVPISDLYEELIDKSGYVAALEAKPGRENRNKVENVRELLTSIVLYSDGDTEEPTLSGFLDEISLYTNLDTLEDNDNCVVMMTMHSAKGLEFPNVFLVGAEEGIFPGYRSIGEQEEMEEERRLCYVAMTRAKQQLYITCAKRRMIFGKTSANSISRFVEEIPEELVEFSQPDYIVQEEKSSAYESGNEDSYFFGGSDFSSRAYGTGRRKKSTSRIPADSGYAEASAGGSAYKKGKTDQTLRLKRGDTVKHRAFGKGVVLSVQAAGNDSLVEIAFDDVGTKRFLLRAASKFMTVVKD